MIEIELPYPPSANHYWRHIPIPGRKMAVRVLISEEGRNYIEKVERAVRKSGLKKMSGALAVKLSIYCPNWRRRDIDNLRKPLYDALSKAGVWEDDSFVAYDVAQKYHSTDSIGRIIVKIKSLTDKVIVKAAGAWME